MKTSEQTLDAKVAAEDIIADLERAINRANAVLIMKPAREIHAASPELFRINLALVRVRRAASEAKIELLKAIRMPLRTRFIAVASAR